MKFRTSIHDYEIQSIFDRFKRLVGENTWLRRTKALKAEIKGNRFLLHHHLAENQIAYALSECSDLHARHGAIPVYQLDCTPVYPAIAFAANSLSMIDLMDKTSGQRMIRRIQGAFNNPEDIRALQLEFTAANHFTRRGHKITWSELQGGGTYDLLVADLGPMGLEVECKSFSESKGRKITSRQSIDFWHLMQPALMAVANKLTGGLTVVLTLSSKMPSNFNDRKNLVSRIARVILAGKNQTLPGAEITLRDFDPKLMDGFSGKEGDAPRELVDTITGTQNRQVLVTGLKSGGCVIFVIQSRQDDNFFSAIKHSVKRAATEQLTGTRPGLLLVEFSGMSTDSLVDLATHDHTSSNDPTSLRLWTSDFLANAVERDHIVGIGYLSKGAMTRLDKATVTSRGSAYIFPRKTSPFWDEAFVGLFGSMD
jgi:hypothetical protein